MTNLKCTKANNSTFSNPNPMKNLRGHIRIDPAADPSPYMPIPDGAQVLGTVTCGTSPPGALVLMNQPTTDYDDTPYPFALRYVTQGRWQRLPMRKTLVALSHAGYSITNQHGTFSFSSP